ncbi:MAG TPA: metallophosphoesterase [Agriterribacter sp.]|nr:metallophosphoesterase [Agriterribacter sp.]
MKKKLSLLFLSPFSFLILIAQQARPHFVIQPYLQYATKNSIRIYWETSDSSSTQVQYGAAKFNTGKPNLSRHQTIPGLRSMHHIELTGLDPQTNYFYRVLSVLPGGDTIASQVNTFQTAVKDSSAFAFAVFSDSQRDHADTGAWGRVSTQAYQERPNFALHAGDLVDLGYIKDDWVNEFFAPSNAFMKTIPLYTIPGNHEHDAAYYYQYMYIPQPYFYSFKYGNAEFFMVDTDQFQEKGTGLYNTVEQALAKSTAYWKFVVHHHPPYSSDEDDFGNTHAEASTLGDDEVRSLVPLYEKYGVDIVFYGHIHTYERTWPINGNKVADRNGVIYLNVGGAGGGLEKAAPTRSWFTNKVNTIHHFVYVAIHNNNLQFQAIDENGVLFDQFTLTESRKNKTTSLTPAGPVVQHSRRIFTDTIQVQLIPAQPNEEVRYTLDGSEPGINSKRYLEKVILNKTTSIKTVAFNQFGKSRVNTFLFTREKEYGAVNPTNLQQGLKYQYFTGTIKDEDSIKFKNIQVLKSGKVPDLDFVHISHQQQFWGVVYDGYIEVPEDGYYRFYGHADHILRLHVHDNMLFEELDREINYDADVYLKKGYHPVKIEYYNSRMNRAFLELYYSGPGIERQPIPSTAWWRNP